MRLNIPHRPLYTLGPYLFPAYIPFQDLIQALQLVDDPWWPGSGRLLDGGGGGGLDGYGCGGVSNPKDGG